MEVRAAVDSVEAQKGAAEQAAGATEEAASTATVAVDSGEAQNGVPEREGGVTEVAASMAMVAVDSAVAQKGAAERRRGRWRRWHSGWTMIDPHRNVGVLHRSQIWCRVYHFHTKHVRAVHRQRRSYFHVFVERAALAT